MSIPATSPPSYRGLRGIKFDFMLKLEQLKKELKALVGNPDLDSVIEGKIDDAWREGKNDSDENWVKREDRYNKNLKAQLSPEEQGKMEKSHCWQQINDGWEHEECVWCGLDEHSMFNTPQYCDVKEL